MAWRGERGRKDEESAVSVRKGKRLDGVRRSAPAGTLCDNKRLASKEIIKSLRKNERRVRELQEARSHNKQAVILSLRCSLLPFIVVMKH